MIKKIIEFSKQFNPSSVFIYGSQATGETTPNSDYEVGLIFPDESYISRREIKAKQDFNNVNSYPFRHNNLNNYTIDTPFPKKLFVYWLIESGKTIFGKDVISQIKTPSINQSDLIGAIHFELGIAFCSFLTMRQGDRLLASEEFSKSCLHGLKILVLAKHGKFLTKYQDIYRYRKRLSLPAEYVDVIEAAYRFRQETTCPEHTLIYKNMSFLNYIQDKLTAKPE